MFRYWQRVCIFYSLFFMLLLLPGGVAFCGNGRCKENRKGPVLCVIESLNVMILKSLVEC